jgi:hypothetical protein
MLPSPVNASGRSAFDGGLTNSWKSSMPAGGLNGKLNRLVRLRDQRLVELQQVPL